MRKIIRKIALIAVFMQSAIAAIAQDNTHEPNSRESPAKTPDSIIKIAKESVLPQIGSEIATANGKTVAWDEFFHNRSMIWTCREIATGKFVNRGACATQIQEDLVWPDKNVPPHYKGN